MEVTVFAGCTTRGSKPITEDPHHAPPITIHELREISNNRNTEQLSHTHYNIHWKKVIFTKSSIMITLPILFRPRLIMAHREWDLDCKVYVGGLSEDANK